MRPLIWSDDAEADLEALTDYVAQDDVVAAVGMRDEIERQVERLAEFPYSGRPGRMKGTRELVVARTPYIVVYTVQGTIRLTRALHGAQKWPA
jgi:toxin ParE1/3/4